MEVSAELHDPAAVPRGIEPKYSLDKRLVRPQSRYGDCRLNHILSLSIFEHEITFISTVLYGVTCQNPVYILMRMSSIQVSPYY
jgi:hypothetical protein